MDVLTKLLLTYGGFFIFFVSIREFVHAGVFGLPLRDSFRKKYMAELTSEFADFHGGDMLSFWGENIQYISYSNHMMLFTKYYIATRDESDARGGTVWRWSKLHYLIERQYYLAQHSKRELPIGEDKVL